MADLRFLRAAALGAGLVGLAACGPRISSDRDESIAIPHGATWAWASRDSTAAGEHNVAESHEIMHQRFRRALEAGMLSKGFHKVDDAAQADFTLTYHVGVPQQGGRQPGHPRVAVATGFYGVWGWGSYYPWGPWYGRYGRRGWAPYGGFGWGWYGPPVFGWGMAVPYPYAYGPNRSSVVIAILRQSASGQVAWSGQIVTDNYDANMPMGRVQSVVNRLLKDLD